MKTSIKLLAFLILVTFLNNVKAQDADEEWIQLFNGVDLTGWIPKIKGYAAGENFGNTFRVEDGVIKVSYDAYEAFDNRYGHLFFEKPFGNYIIRVEYRFVGEQIEGGAGWAFRNSGIMVHGQTPESMDVDQDFPVSIEVQLLGGNGKDKRSTGNLCTPGTNVVMNDELITRHCTSSGSKTYHGDQWVTAEVEVRGNEIIKHFINGDLVLDYTKPQLDPKDEDAKKLIHDGELMLCSGTISLQSESHPIEFRKVELKILE